MTRSFEGREGAKVQAGEGPEERVQTLLIDNYDSYTFNLYQMLAEVNRSPPIVIENDSFNGSWEEAWAFYKGKVDNIVISPGPGHPAKKADFGLCAEALLSSEVPILGVCLGHQGLAQLYGGKVVHAPEGMHGRLSTVEHKGDALFSHIPSSFRVVRYHSLIVEEDSLPSCIEAIAWTREREANAASPSSYQCTRSSARSLIMGLKHRSKPFWGVQFHPESVCSEHGHQLLANFKALTLGKGATKLTGIYGRGNEVHSHPHVSRALSGPSISSATAYSLSDSNRQVLAEPRCEVLVQRVPSHIHPEAEQVFCRLFSQSEVSFWLDSSNYEPPLSSISRSASSKSTQHRSRFSFMGDGGGPLAKLIQYDVTSGKTTVTQMRRRKRIEVQSDFAGYLESELRHLGLHKIVSVEKEERKGVEDRGDDTDHESEDGADSGDILPFNFHCGLVGYFGYETLGVDDPSILRRWEQGGSFCHPSSSENPPTATFLLADRVVAYDHDRKEIYLLCLQAVRENGEEGGDEEACRSEDGKASCELKEWFDTVQKVLQECAADTQTEEKKRKLSLRSEAQRPQLPMFSCYSSNVAEEEIIFRPNRKKERYLKDIEEVLQEIRNGETYEVCLTNQLVSETVIEDPLSFYLVLRKRNPAPYAAFFRVNFTMPFPCDDSLLPLPSLPNFAVCCSSPEKFISVDKDGWVESKPIKGTRPRGKGFEEDRERAEELASNEKDRAENLMIVDLVRNDLGRVCEVGSVHVPQLMQVESYATVHQLVSTVRGKKKESSSLLDVVRACFPGGSMTGAPKKRTMSIIRRLEGAKRGIYSGSLGFLSISGAADLNIVIRTAICTREGTTLGTGGAIVALSSPEEEYEEMLLKARALVSSVGFSLLGDPTRAKVVF